MTVAGLAVLSITPIGRAIARRIAGGQDAESQREVRALRAEGEQLKSDLDSVHGRLDGVDELHGRLDFAERVLAQKDKGALPGQRS